MMFMHSPLTQPHFTPHIHAPSVAYWLLQPGSDSEDDKTVGATNKQQDTTNPVGKAKQWPLLLDNFEVQEEEGHVVFSTDLPGIKPADLKVEFRDGALHVAGSRAKGAKKQSFLRSLTLDEDAVDVENLAATLEDGILTVKVPKANKKTEEKEGKTEGEARKIVVSKTSPPEDAIEMNMEIDLPGVKVENLEIVLGKNGILSVYGERKSGATRTEAYMLNTRKADTSKLEAYLNDGVLTIRAPAKVHKANTVAVNGQLPPVPQKPELKEA